MEEYIREEEYKAKIEKVSFEREDETVNALAVSQDELSKILRTSIVEVGLYYSMPSKACSPAVATVDMMSVLLNTTFTISIVNQIPEEAQEVVQLEAGKTLRSFAPAIRIKFDSVNYDFGKFEAAMWTQKLLVEAGRVAMQKLDGVEYFYS